MKKSNAVVFDKESLHFLEKTPGSESCRGPDRREKMHKRVFGIKMIGCRERLRILTVR